MMKFELRWLFRCLCIACLPCSLVGCLILPVDDEEPFANDQLAFVEPGSTTRAEVLEQLGPPALSRKGDRIALYLDEEVKAWAMTQYGSGPIVKFACCVIEYDDEDLVADAETVSRMDSSQGCTDDGLCFKAVYEQEGEIGVAFVGAYVFARPQDDLAAKVFATDSERCGVYLYKTGSKPQFRDTLQVLRSGQETNYVDSTGYLHWLQPPGPIEITAKELRGYSAVSPVFTLECEPGALYFLNVKHSGTALGFLTGKKKLTWSLDEPSVGKRQVDERRLILE
jgi:hypothetical protein